MRQLGTDPGRHFVKVDFRCRVDAQGRTNVEGLSARPASRPLYVRRQLAVDGMPVRVATLATRPCHALRNIAPDFECHVRACLPEPAHDQIEHGPGPNRVQHGAFRGVRQKLPHRLASCGAEQVVPLALRTTVQRMVPQDVCVALLDDVLADEWQPEPASQRACHRGLPRPGQTVDQDGASTDARAEFPAVPGSSHSEDCIGAIAGSASPCTHPVGRMSRTALSRRRDVRTSPDASRHAAHAEMVVRPTASASRMRGGLS
jgi:hypothetical protein